MQPTDSFWGGVGEAVGTSPGWMVVGAALIIGVLFILAKYLIPSRERIKGRELDIREREAQNDADRVKANAMLAESQRQTNTLIDGMRQSLDASSARIDVIVTEIHGSRDGSKRMGETVEQTHELASSTHDIVTHTAEQVDDIRRILAHGPENSD